MHHPLAPTRGLALAAALATAAALPGQAVPQEELDLVELPAFTVSSSQPNQYRAVDTSSASRVRTSIQDTPASISVLTSELLQDIAPMRLYEATRYVSGISEGRGDGFADRQIIRGFENLNRTVDNFASIQSENADPLLIDRVEVLRGPSAIIAPTGAPGGVVTIVSKAPLWKQQRLISATVGKIDAQRVEVDLTGPFSEGSPFAYRVLAAYQDGELAADGTRDERKIIGGSVTYRISPRTNLTLRGSYEDRWLFVYLPVFIDSSSVNGADAKLAQGFGYGNNRNGTETWAHRGGEYGTADLLLTTSFGEHWSSRFAAKYQYDLQRDQYMAAVTPSLANRYNPATGQQTPDHTWARDPATGQYLATPSPLFDITNIQRRPFLPEGHTRDFALQYDLAGSYRFGGVSSTTVAGVAYDDRASYSRQLIGPSLPFNLLAPVYGATPVFNQVTVRQASDSTTWQYYINEQLGLFEDRLLLTAGGVRVSAETSNHNRLTNARTHLDDAQNLGLFGAVYKLTDDLSLYGSRSVNAVPTIANNQPLWQEGQQWEFGAKLSAYEDRLSVTFARFEIAQTNVTVPNPAFQSDPTQPQALISDLRNYGYELEVTGGLTRNLSIIASATYLKERDSLGRPVRAIAERNAALLLNYRFTAGALDNLSVFAGVTYTGRRSGEAPAVDFTPLGVVTQPSFFLAPVTLLNLGARYTRGPVTLALNIDNALDERYIAIPTARTNAGLGLPRNVRLTATYRF